MPRTPTLENPFAPEKHRSADDPKFVGKILGAEAEKKMREAMKSTTERSYGTSTDIVTEAERTKIAGERGRERTRRELLSWMQEIGVRGDWGQTAESLVDNTFTVHPDGTVTVEGYLDLSYPHDRGDADLQEYKSAPGRLPPLVRRVEGDVSLDGSDITSLEGFPESVGGDIYLGYTDIPSLEGLPPPERVGGTIYFSTFPRIQEQLIEEAKRKGYRVEVEDNDFEDNPSAPLSLDDESIDMN